MTTTFPPRCARRFKPGRLLASGGFGAVFLATQRELDRQVVIKLLHADAERDKEFVERFLREARVTAALRHPHIVEVVDHDVEDGVPWIAYEYLAGPTVRERIASGPMEPSQALEMARQVCLALEAAHAGGVLHRDIKPDNVMAQSSGHWKVTDFGIARWAGDAQVKTATGVILGTPEYLAPEVIMGGPASPSSDIYAVGVMLYETLTGRFPHSGDLRSILTSQKLDKVARPCALQADLDPAVEGPVLRALAYDASRRYASARAMVADLEQALSGELARHESGRSRTRASHRLRQVEPATMRSGVRTRRHALPTKILGDRGERTATDGAHLAPSTPRWRAWAGSGLVVLAVATGIVAWHLVARSSATTPGPQRALNAIPGPRIGDVTPRPPRRAIVTVDAGRSGHATMTVSDDADHAHRLPLAVSTGPAMLDGLLPGHRYTLSLRSDDASPVATQWTLTMPRPVDVEVQAQPGEDDVIAVIRADAPVRVAAQIQRIGEGSVVWRWQGTPRIAHREVVRHLHPDTEYAFSVTSLDTDRYLTFPSTHFRTLHRGEQASVLDAFKDLGRPLPGAFSFGVAAGRISVAGALAPKVSAASEDLLLEVARRRSILDEPLQCTLVAAALGLLHDPESLEPMAAMLTRSAFEDNSRLIGAMGDIYLPGAVDALFTKARSMNPEPSESRAETFAIAAVHAQPAYARTRALGTLARLNDAGAMEEAVALTILEDDDDPATRRKIIDLARRHPSPPSIFAAARTLRQMGTAAPIDDVRALLTALPSHSRGTWQSYDDLVAHENLLIALARVGAPADIGLADPYLDPTQITIEFSSALDVLLSIGGQAGVKRVAGLVTSADPPHARVAAVALGRAGAHGEGGIASLIARLGDHTTSNGRFPRALGMIGDRQAIAPLVACARGGLDALARRTAGSVSSSAIADVAEALWALGRLGDRDATPMLREALGSTEWYVRLRAMEALGRLRVQAARPAIEAIARSHSESHVMKSVAEQALTWIDRGPPEGGGGGEERGRMVLIDPLDRPIDTRIEVVPGDVLIPHVTGGYCDPADLARSDGGGAMWHPLLIGIGPGNGATLEGPQPFLVHRPGVVRVSAGWAMSSNPGELVNATGFLTVWFERVDAGPDTTASVSPMGLPPGGPMIRSFR